MKYIFLTVIVLIIGLSSLTPSIIFADTKQRQAQLRREHYQRIYDARERRYQRQLRTQRLHPRNLSSFKSPIYCAPIYPRTTVIIRPRVIYPSFPCFPSFPSLGGSYNIPNEEPSFGGISSAETLHDNLWKYPQRYRNLDSKLLEEDAETLHDNLWKYPQRYKN